jgi:hypothetical protein
MSGHTAVHLWFESVAGLPDFSWCMIPKQEKMYQINTNCTKWS